MRTTSKLNNIQVLRAFAALIVVLFHTGFTFPHMRIFGSFGVDVFFVISGYIMARILDPKSDANSDFFFRRRVIRIVPPYWFFTILLFLAAAVVPGLMGSTRASAAELFKSLFFIPFAKYPGTIQPLLFIGWSLNYEMFFYLALAIGIFLHVRLGQGAKRIDAVWIGACIVLLTMLISNRLASKSVIATFFGRELILEFLLGILSYYFCRLFTYDAARRIRVLALLICFASAAALIAIQDLNLGLSSRTLTLGIPAFLLISSASLLSQAGWDIQVTWLVLIGDASYILYLVHPYCEYSIDRLLSRHGHWLKRDTASGAAIGVTLSLIVALVIHVYGERPTVRFLNRRFGGRRKSTEFSTPVV